MSRLAYIDPIGGLAGDMLLAALLDAGASRARLLELPRSLGIGPTEIRVREVTRRGVRALHVDVRPRGEPPPRTWRELRLLLERAEAKPWACECALAGLELLARAASAHAGAPVDDTAFPEPGGVDTLVDLLGVAVLLEDLGIRSVSCSPLPVALPPRSFRREARVFEGDIASSRTYEAYLLRAWGAAAAGSQLRVTPTGTALSLALTSAWVATSPLGDAVEHVGYGAGSDDFEDVANVVRVEVGEARRAV